ESKDLFQFWLYYERMCQVTYKPKRKFIVYNIFHFNTTGYRFEEMLVMPQSIRPKTLFIYKIFFFFYMGDLGNPFSFDPGYRGNNILNQLPGVHRPVSARYDIETHIIRCDGLKIFWI